MDQIRNAKLNTLAVARDPRESEPSQSPELRSLDDWEMLLAGGGEDIPVWP